MTSHVEDSFCLSGERKRKGNKVISFVPFSDSSGSACIDEFQWPTWGRVAGEARLTVTISCPPGTAVKPDAQPTRQWDQNCAYGYRGCIKQIVDHTCQQTSCEVIVGIDEGYWDSACSNRVVIECIDDGKCEHFHRLDFHASMHKLSFPVHVVSFSLSLEIWIVIRANGIIRAFLADKRESSCGRAHRLGSW